MTGWRLISDVGGTNVRFARAQGAKDVSEIRTYLVNRFPSFTSAAKAYLDETGGGDGCTGAAIGAAGLVAFGKVRLTNASWDISEAEVSTELGLPCRLVNDVEAVAFSLPVLSEFRHRRSRPLDTQSGCNAACPDSEYWHRVRSSNAYSNGGWVGILPQRSWAYVAHLSRLGR